MNIKRSLFAGALATSLLIGLPMTSEAKTVTKRVCKTVNGKRTCRSVKVKVAKKAASADTTAA